MITVIPVETGIQMQPRTIRSRAGGNLAEDEMTAVPRRGGFETRPYAHR